MIKRTVWLRNNSFSICVYVCWSLLSFLNAEHSIKNTPAAKSAHILIPHGSAVAED